MILIKKCIPVGYSTLQIVSISCCNKPSLLGITRAVTSLLIGGKTLTLWKLLLAGNRRTCCLFFVSKVKTDCSCDICVGSHKIPIPMQISNQGHNIDVKSIVLVNDELVLLVSRPANLHIQSLNQETKFNQMDLKSGDFIHL